MRARPPARRPAPPPPGRRRPGRPGRRQPPTTRSARCTTSVSARSTDVPQAVRGGAAGRLRRRHRRHVRASSRRREVVVPRDPAVQVQDAAHRAPPPGLARVHRHGRDRVELDRQLRLRARLGRLGRVLRARGLGVRRRHEQQHADRVPEGRLQARRDHPGRELRHALRLASLPENGQASSDEPDRTLAKRGDATSPLAGSGRVRRIFHAGESQQGGSVITYATAFHFPDNAGYFVQTFSTARAINFGPVCGGAGAPNLSRLHAGARRTRAPRPHRPARARRPGHDGDGHGDRLRRDRERRAAEGHPHVSLRRDGGHHAHWRRTSGR